MITTLTLIKTMSMDMMNRMETMSPHLGRREHRLELLVRIVRRLARNVVIPGTSSFSLTPY